MSGGVFAQFHRNLNINESNGNTISLTGILRLILIKYIASYINENQIQSNEIKKIIIELKKGRRLVENQERDIKDNLNETSGLNILSYSNYVNSKMTDGKINDIFRMLPRFNKNEIINLWRILSLYEEFNKLFEEEIKKAIEKSYFDYSLISLSMSEQTNRERFIQSMENCPNLIVKYLFHGTLIDPISKIITNGFLYPRRAFYGIGITFSDMLDYIFFYTGGKDYRERRDNFNRIPRVNQIFCCVSAEVYYDKRKLHQVYDFSLHVRELDHFPTYEELKKNFPEKMVEKNGINLAIVEPNRGQVIENEEIINDNKKGKFLGTEYVITEFDQILPLYGITLKRNEYLIVWRDPHFKGASEYYEILEECKLFIYEYAQLNAYFESSIEKALELIKRKKFNKIILISNIGLDLSGKKFVEIARQILGFNVLVLFFSKNKGHFSWLQNFPNALFANKIDFFRDYIMNYNEKGLLDLKKKIEKFYNIKLNFDKDFLKFPKFINQGKYDDIIFEEIIPYFRKIVIKNSNSILGMSNDGKPYFITNYKLDVNSYIWYVTIIKNEITLFSNGFYLGANLYSKKVTGEKYMNTYKLEKISDKEYLLYYKNKDNVLTVNGNNAIIMEESPYKINQKFKFIDSDFMT